MKAATCRGSRRESSLQWRPWNTRPARADEGQPARSLK